MKAAQGLRPFENVPFAHAPHDPSELGVPAVSPCPGTQDVTVKALQAFVDASKGWNVPGAHAVHVLVEFTTVCSVPASHTRTQDASVLALPATNFVPAPHDCTENAFERSHPGADHKKSSVSSHGLTAM